MWELQHVDQARAVAELVGKQPKVTYNSRAGKFIGVDGRFVTQGFLLNLLDQEIKQTEARLMAQSRLLNDGRVTLPEWEQRFAEILRNSHLRMAALGSGGRQQLSPRHFGAVGFQLQRQYTWLDKFAQRIADGSLTPAQILARSKLYAKSSRIGYYRSQQLSRINEGYAEGKRSLDPQAKHCPSCIVHSTKGRWVPIEQIVPPGSSCECGNHCKCSVAYRLRPSPGILNVGKLAAE